MFGFLDKETFPWWHPVVKWGLPIGLATTITVGAGLMLTGSVAVPAFLSAFNVASAYFATLEGFSAIAALGAASIAVFTTVGFLTSFLLRATILCSVNEAIATNAQRHNGDLLRTHQAEKTALEERLRTLNETCDQQRRDYETALTTTDNRLEQITNQYNRLLGAQQMLERSKTKETVKSPIKAPPKPIGKAANDQPEPKRRQSKGL